MYSALKWLLITTIVLAVYVFLMAGLIAKIIWLLLLVLVIAYFRRRDGELHAYGTARWAQACDIPHLLKGTGLVLGTIDTFISRREGLRALFNSPPEEAVRNFISSCYRKQPKEVVRLSDAVHTMVVAPTGVGKGVSCVIPFLLSCPESVVVLDYKGENAKITASARRKMGHRVVIIDPYYMVTKSPDTFNPLDPINGESADALDDCRDLATAMVIRTGQEKETFWNDSAEIWLAAMIALTVSEAPREMRNLQAVRGMLTDPSKMQEAIKRMCESDKWEGLLARYGHQLTHFKERELANILSSTNRFQRFLDTIAITRSTMNSSFDPAELLNGKMTIYLVMPPEHMRAQMGLLRLWITSLLRAVVKGGLSDRRVHFVLDEAASLGHMEALDDAIDKFRGYGVRIQLYYQSLGQLKPCWPDGRDQTVLSNTTQVYFGVQDYDTAEHVSKQLGEYTQVISSGGTSYGGSSQEANGQGGRTYSQSWNTNENWQQAARKLLKPEEVITLNERIAITFTPGALPIWTWLSRYYEPQNDEKTSVARLCLDTACLFLTALMLAVMVTAALLRR